jgi:prepilin-type N-terminal cleavage/methylation domain-containing protein
MRNEKGITLVEMLAALALSSIVLIGVYSFLTTMLKADERVINDTDIRNEVVLIQEHLNNFFKNSDGIEIVSTSPLSFHVVEQKTNIDASGSLITTTEKRLFSYDGQDIYLDGEKINSYDYFVSAISLENRNANSHLKFTVQHKDKTDLVKEVYLIYSSGGELDEEATG